MYAKVKLPDGFIKGDCENCPLCTYHPEIDDTYDDDGYCNDDGFQDWNECLIKECTEDDPYNNVDGTKDYPQDNCPMEIIEQGDSSNIVLPDDQPIKVVHESWNTK